MNRDKMDLPEWWPSNRNHTIGDCRDITKHIPDESIDLIATDPPYGISFMHAKWDTFNEVVEPQGAYQEKKGFKKLPRQKPTGMIEFFVPIWKECLRILKPGAFAFVMCAPRQDVMCKQIMALEQAGFNTGFSSILWAFAQGFPKAQNISKAIDKKACMKGLEKKLGRKPTKEESDEAWKGFRKILRDTVNPDGRIQNHEPSGKISREPFCGGGITSNERNDTIPTTPEAKILDGSYAGFQPKPAVEIILVAMKPLSEKTYMDQALKNGKGISWLDACRIPYESDGNIASNPLKRKNEGYTHTHGIDENPANYSLKKDAGNIHINPVGRFPANLLVSDDVLNDGKDYDKGGDISNKNIMSNQVFGKYDKPRTWEAYGDSGSYSRYFDLDKWWMEKLKNLPEEVQKTFPFMIVPKPSKSEKNKGCGDLKKKVGHNRFDKCSNCGGYILQNPDRPSACKCENPHREDNVINGNYHPTVKAVRLFSYLITLGSREGDIVLDPFVGSGTTLVSADLMHRQGLGIDNDEEMDPIITGRTKRENYKLEEFLE